MQNRNYLFSSLGEAGPVGWGKVTFVSENPKWVAPLSRLLYAARKCTYFLTKGTHTLSAK